MKIFYVPLVIILTILTANATFAQTGTMPGASDKIKPEDKSNDGTSSFKFGINYSSNDVFMGRTDTARTPTIIPQVKYTFKNGIYLSGNLEFIPGRKKKKLDGGEIAAGYDFDITDDLSGGASLTKAFYSPNSTQIASSIRETVNANITYDIGEIISPTLSADYNFNKQGIAADEFVNLGITHDFNVTGLFGDADVFIVSPTATVNSGTENFYDAYLTTKKIKNTKRSAAQNALIAAYTARLGKYNLLDYEFSAPVEYKSGKFIFTFNPTYAIVQNQLPAQIMTRISNKPAVFYFETGVTLKF